MGKQHDYDSDKLPEVIKVKAGDSIAVNYKFKAADVDSMRGNSDNSDITVKGLSNKGNGNFQVIIHSDKQGKAKVSWIIELEDGRTIGNSLKEVVFE